MLRICLLCFVLTACASPQAPTLDRDYPITPVPFTDVQVTGGFWASRLDTNREVTLPYAFQKCAETGRIDHFALAAGQMEGPFTGKRYDDSDVFKVIEAAAYTLQTRPDPGLDAYLDSLIALIGAAQEPDGYLYTTRTAHPDKPVDTSPGRWSDLNHGHELYNVGHLYEAAVAHYQATGKRSLLDIALKNAGLLLDTFGPEGKSGFPGHQEIEIGLAKLYRVTGDRRYLDLAHFFLEERGRYQPQGPAHGNVYDDPAYTQHHRPVTEQAEAVGHAVRAGYMYSGMADIAALRGDSAYIAAIDRLWEDVVSHKMYLTGGVGARHSGEAYGQPYELPNADAYAETCAAVSILLWSHRLFLLHGRGEYYDIFERTLYNGFLSGVSPGGETFFYVNPLASDGGIQRQPWYRTACCPTNVVRFLASLPGYVYAQRGTDLYVNLYLDNEASLHRPDYSVQIRQHTQYPWEGEIRLEVSPDQPAEFALCLRLPGWTDNQAFPSDLYRFQNRTNTKLSLRVNGELVYPKIVDGYARVQRTWEAGDVVMLSLPMPVRRVRAHPSVADNQGKLAIMRGPLVYCVEGIDHGGSVQELQIPRLGRLTYEPGPPPLDSLYVVRGTALKQGTEIPLMAVPYFAWAQRDSGDMRVWIPVEGSDVRAEKSDTGR
ncbi:MAG: glycoside hydrolase family 127 protein [Bacteroidetes bacterium]|nr:MAG: glycoside hydrolase family 127 protein [Bacteroidota bacterium]